jgi:hypothetical protein
MQIVSMCGFQRKGPEASGDVELQPREEPMPRSVNHFSIQSKTQRSAILRLLIDARGAWVPLPKIMACAAQYNSRLLELRRLGFNVENRTENVDGARHSWFRLLTSPAPPAPEAIKEKTLPVDSVASKSNDWYERETGKPRSVAHAQNNDLPLFIGARP